MLKSPARTTRLVRRSRGGLQRLGVDVRPEEVGLCWLLFFAHALILAFQYISKSVRQATYIDTFSAEQLPFVYLLIAICTFPILQAYSRLVDRWDQRKLIAWTSCSIAAVLLVFRQLFGMTGGASKAVSVIFYLWVAITGVLLVSQFWSYAADQVNSRQAKRLFGFIGAGGILGSILGGQAARWISLRFETRDSLLGGAFLLLMLAALVLLRGKRSGRRNKTLSGSITRPRWRRKDREGDLDASDGWSLIRGSRYLQLIAGVMLISAMVSQVVDLQFSWWVEEHVQGLDARTATFGNLFSIMGAAAFIFQMAFTARIHRHLGTGFAMHVLPASNLLGTLIFAVAVMHFPLLIAPAVWMLKIGENGLRYSLDQATRELLFQPLRDRDRPKAKAFIDVFVQRLAKGAAALLLMTVTFDVVSVEQSFWFSIVLIGIWVVLLRPTQKRYIASFRDSLLHSENSETRKLDLGDVHTLEVLFEGLGSADSREVLNSLELLASHQRGRLVPPMMLHHEDASVRCKTLQILQAEGRSDVAPLIEQLLVDPNPTVRATATVALVGLTPQDIHQMMVDRLRDPDVRVRSVAVSYLSRHGDPQRRRQADTSLNEMLADGDPRVRLEAARAIGGIEEPHHQAGLVQLLYDTDPKVVRGAIESVSRRVAGGSGNPLYAPILVSHLHNRKLKHDARNALVAYGENVIPALQHFLVEPGEEIWVRRALPKTIARIGGKTAVSALIESIAAADPFLRRKVIESLAVMRLRGDEDFELPQGPIESQINSECRGYLLTLLDLISIRRAHPIPLDGPRVFWPRGLRNNQSEHAPHILERLLSDRMDDHLSNLFGLLTLLHSPTDVRASYRSLLSRNPTLRANALEYLDHLLIGDVRRLVFAVIDDLTLEERVHWAHKLFGLSPASSQDTLRRLASSRPPGDADAAWVTAAALHYIHDNKVRELYSVLRLAAEHDSAPLVQETTEYLLEDLGLTREDATPYEPTS